MSGILDRVAERLFAPMESSAPKELNISFVGMIGATLATVIVFAMLNGKSIPKKEWPLILFGLACGASAILIEIFIGGN